FYMGMNLGGIVGPICYGIIAVNCGWLYGFLTSAAMITLSFIVLLLRKKQAYNHTSLMTSSWQQWLKLTTLLLISVVSIAIVTLLFFSPNLFQYALKIIAGIVILAMAAIAYYSPSTQRKKLTLLLICMLFMILYFACAAQTGSSLMLFIVRHVDTHLLGWKIPVEAFASLQPIAIIIIAPVITWFWNHRIQQHADMRVLIKRILIGLLLAGASFLLFSLAAYSTAWPGFNYPLLNIIIGNFVLGAGELYIMPSMMSAVTYLAPERLQGTLMGVLFFSLAISFYIGSKLAMLSAANNFSLYAGSSLYYHAFISIALITFAVTIVYLCCLPLLYRLAK
ncbi:MAG: hypothetical protein JKY13_02035, partial [Gammaproteobacteria bacterium]|nr:hypothetical protein [Gammaproteobacteria bacterium]